MLRTKLRQMTQEEANVFLSKPFPSSPLESHIKRGLISTGFDGMVCDSMIKWCAFLCGQDKTRSKLWAWQLAYLSKYVYDSPISIAFWTDQFPNGVPTESCYDYMWKLQKDGDVNLIDDMNYWPGHSKCHKLIGKCGISEKDKG